MSTALGAGYAAKAVTIFVVIMSIARRHLRRHHPFDRFGPGNQVTTARALLVALAAALIGEPHVPALALTAIGLGAAATALDGLDGFLARRAHMTSAFGARFDLEIDALLIQVLAILVWRYEKAGAWILASGLARYLFVAAGRLWRWLRRPLPGSARGRAVCVLQIAGLLVALAPRVTPPLSTTVAAASLAALLYSFAVDTLWLWRRRLNHR